jgi:hypothetical protein
MDALTTPTESQLSRELPDVLAEAIGFPEGTEYSLVSLTLPDGMMYDTWVEVGQSLRSSLRGLTGATNMVYWWIGEWLKHGEHAYGVKFAQAAEALGWAEQSLMNIQWVTSHVDISRRREALSFSHHVEVASLPPPQQAEVLDLAEEEELSVREVREKATELKDTNDGRDPVRARVERAVQAARLALEEMNHQARAVMIVDLLIVPLASGLRRKDSRKLFLENCRNMIEAELGDI